MLLLCYLYKINNHEVILTLDNRYALQAFFYSAVAKIIERKREEQTEGTRRKMKEVWEGGE